MGKELGSEQLTTSQTKSLNKLEGDKALLLWLRGREAWNDWMKKHPEAEVSFEGVVFSYLALSERLKGKRPVPQKLKSYVDFSGYIFNGYISFDGAEFHSKALFRNAKFSGVSSFFHTCFKDLVHFSNSEFHDRTDFSSVEFINEVDFSRVKFKNFADFFNANFGSLSEFYEIEVWETINFRSSVFLEETQFIGAVFKNNVSFTRAKFFGGAVFNRASFCKEFSLKNCQFLSNVDFGNASFGNTFYCSPLNSEKIKSIDFKGASFEKSFSISGHFECIPDLRLTKTSHHVDLSHLSVKLNRIFIKNCGLERAIDAEDSERLCRLKEIAESNKNHNRALAFHADEQRASRWGVLNSWQSMLDMLYSLTSNYGQSLARPCFYLVLSIILFAAFSLKQPENIHKEEGQLKTALTISIATVTPFISISKIEREAGIKKLYGQKPPEDYGLYSYAHAGISFVFIFLIGLGLRNRYRI
ncbi:hypothetical protein JF50_07835 [Pseudoalteromonas luteoviolacea]|uniref:Pentapeptide repeat-containing protein n=1 Tax=Pseudoalteromonas luteoviolacea TaxID=43657 RepID=A0A0C1MR73_9GAMM|nr:hypothetical protein JF50_07835 [Pseudoalteromonas luteoviolacea]